MNRCPLPCNSATRCVVACATALILLPALAPSDILLDDKPGRPSPDARIHSTEQLLVH